MDSGLVLKQIRKAREKRVDVGRYKFTFRRPTDVEMMKLGREDAQNHEVARDFVIDWEGVTAADMVASGGSDPLEFNRSLWAEWLSDRPDFWNPIADAVIDEYRSHMRKREEEAKNL